MTEEKKTRKLEIRPTQLVAGALAAVTAAFLGSTLGVAGTVIGAGVASLVSTLGSAFYQHSLDRTGASLRARVSAFRTNPAEATTRRLSPVAKPVLKQAEQVTRVLTPVRGPGDQTTRYLRPVPVDFPSSTVDSPTSDSPTDSPTKSGWRRRWRVLAGLTVAVFLLGMGAVTGVELLRGSPISGGSNGTTVGSLFGGSTQKSTSGSTSTTSSPTTSSPTTSTATTTAPTTTAPTTTAQAPATTTAPTTTTSPETSTTTSAPTTTVVTPTPTP